MKEVILKRRRADVIKLAKKEELLPKTGDVAPMWSVYVNVACYGTVQEC